MVSSSRSTGAGAAHANAGAGEDPGPRMPRWVKAFLVIAAVLVLLLVVVMIASGGKHGPGRHSSSTGSAGAHLTSDAASVTGFVDPLIGRGA